MEKKELTVEELKDIASGSDIHHYAVRGDMVLCATPVLLAEAKMTEADAKRLGIHIVIE